MKKLNKLRRQGRVYQEFRVAAKRYQCSEGEFSSPHDIYRGERHCVCVAMPWTDANMSPKPWRLRECLDHCTHRENDKPWDDGREDYREVGYPRHG